METVKAGGQTRLNYIDFLKFIGMTGIIMAHVEAPNWAMMLRNFDVPLLVIVSSVLGERSFRKYEGEGIKAAGKYFVSRIKRLVIPTWIFLTLYFGVCALQGQYYDKRYYAMSYCLTRYGIGYVWIILIYLYSALLVPVFSKIKLSVKGIIGMVSVYCLYELACYFQIGAGNQFLDTTFFYIVPYGALTCLGYHFCRMNQKGKRIIAITAALIFTMFGLYYWLINGEPQSVQIAKYPPTLYYLGYGVAWSFFLLLFCEKHTFGIYENWIIKYISIHSLGIYFAHILLIKLYDDLSLPGIWYVKYMIVYVMAFIVVFCGNKLLDFIRKTNFFSGIGKYR